MVANKDELTNWVKAYTHDLYAYSISRVNKKEIAEDLVQNTFLAAVENHHNFAQKSQPKTWLFAILKNKIASYYRQQYQKSENIALKDALVSLFDEKGRMKEPCTSIQWSTDEELLDNMDFIRTLQGCLDGLPKKWSSVVELKYLNSCNSELVCQELNITPANFWQIMHRAKLQLKICLENKWFKTGNVTR